MFLLNIHLPTCLAWTCPSTHGTGSGAWFVESMPGNAAICFACETGRKPRTTGQKELGQNMDFALPANIRIFQLSDHFYIDERGTKGGKRDARIGGFQAPLHRWHEPGSKDVDMEVLIPAYYINYGLNLHHDYHSIHAPSPATPQAIWRQACGRVVRFGQESKSYVP
ncbi:hypothetical protein K504DRAFT_501022 [Pleomassaria siparia CBS 279.74]|uniref:Uncharacterized protein n=1 Tax=Pleomassaria siparia CBS 279.74 TaxID=1314801 RepID=A0A6G1KE12_9PLEO|nr:hypothetical protein K504DRAFT_501022 [Pleomassaria siparia CBS 279.74]